ncbi:MAG: signal peptidase I [Clostridia bacterium]
MYRISDFERSSKRMFIIEKLIIIVVYITIIPIIIYNLTLMIKSYINSTEIPDFFGFKSFVIISESMEPTIMTGDAILVKEVKQEELKEKDIISFHDQGDINTHRIVEILEDDGIIKYKTKGDNNKKEDKELVTYDKIEGVYQFRIKGFGKIVEVIKNKITLVVLLIVLVLISACQVRINKKRLIRKEKRYEYSKNLQQ